MKHLTYATVCSGIECMSAAVIDLPMMPVFFSEIEPFPCAVLKSHFPNVPNLGDMSKIEVTNEGKEISNGTIRIVLEHPLDILAGGTPCQDVSVAGKRSGMQEGSGTRSSLAFEFVRLVRELRPRYVLWENVAGVLSDKSFPEFLGALAECGYGVAYRTLDAQWVRCADVHHQDGRMVSMERAIPQRRRRVWVVGCAGGDVAKSAQILFEHEGVVGNSAPRRRTGQEIANLAQRRNRVHDCVVGGAPGDGECVSLSAKQQSLATDSQLAATLGSNDHKEPQCIALDGDKLKPRENPRKGGNGFGINEDGVSYTLTVPDRHGVAYRRTNPNGEEVANTITRQISEQSGQDARANAVVECYRVDPKSSNSMKSANPHSGFHKAEVSACLDTTIPEPSKAQGGNVVVECRAVENHPNDSRVKLSKDDVCQTISSRCGTGGGNEPMVVFNKECVASAGVTFDATKGFPLADEVSQTQITGSSPGHHVGVVTTNSNGEDVMPTISACEGKQGQQQKDVGGGISCINEPITHNFELYDNAEGLSISLSANRARDTLVITKGEKEK